MKMDGNTILEISYADLKEMLNDFKSDGLNADGCGCALHLNEDDEIQYAIKNGIIRIKEG
jgi:GH35 family endo-1,4-beta-xylanase